MKLYTIETGFFKLDGGAMFGVVPKSLWQRTNPADENNLCTWTTRLLLIEDGKRLILVDTALGEKQDHHFFRHYHRSETVNLSDALAKHGFHPDDVTDVFLTHLHFDHVGGAVVKNGNILETTFKNATYWSNEKHWNWAVHPNPRERASFLKENILPIQESGQLKFIDDVEGFHFTDHIRVRFVHGHTEAMMLPEIDYQGQKILYMADLLPSVGHIPLPYVMGYDIRPLDTLEERGRFWQEAVDGEYLLMLEHDPVHAFCTLHRTEKGIRLKETFSSDVLNA